MDQPNREISWRQELAWGLIILRMTLFLACVVCITVVFLALLRSSSKEGLFRLNVSTLVRPHTPEEAAIMVTRSREGDGDSYLARRDLEAKGLGPEMVRYIVSRDGIDIALVILRPFGDLGWQKFGYAHLVCCPDPLPEN
jgi:hypothetical protein